MLPTLCVDLRVSAWAVLASLWASRRAYGVARARAHVLTRQRVDPTTQGSAAARTLPGNRLPSIEYLGGLTGCAYVAGVVGIRQAYSAGRSLPARGHADRQRRARRRAGSTETDAARDDVARFIPSEAPTVVISGFSRCCAVDVQRPFDV